MQPKFAVRSAAKVRIQGADIFENRRILRSRVFEVDGPFDDGKIRILHAGATNGKPRLGIRINRGMLDAAGIRFVRGFFQPPRRQQGGPLRSIIGK